MNSFAPFTADDETLRQAVNDASIPALMVAVMHLTGNTDHFKHDVKPFTDPLGETDDNLTDDQRAPPWLLPTPLYHEDVTGGMKWLFDHMPYYARWYRFWLFRRDGVDGALPFLTADPAWNGPENAASPENDQLREIMSQYILAQAEGDTDPAVPQCHTQVTQYRQAGYQDQHPAGTKTLLNSPGQPRSEAGDQAEHGPHVAEILDIELL